MKAWRITVKILSYGSSPLSNPVEKVFRYFANTADAAAQKALNENAGAEVLEVSEDPTYLDLAAAQKYSWLTPATLQTLLQHGELPFSRQFGDEYLFCKEDLDCIIARVASGSLLFEITPEEKRAKQFSRKQRQQAAFLGELFPRLAA